MRTIHKTTIMALTLTLGSALGMSLYRLPAAAQSQPATSKTAMPAGVAGRWVATSSSATSYFDKNDRFIGNASGNAQIYEFDGKGNFTYYLMMEMRTGGLMSRVNNSCKGTVTFTDNTFTLHPVSGHYHTEFGSRVTDRPMNSEDMGKLAKPLNWRLETGADGKPRFIVSFSDGSKYEFKPLPAPTKTTESSKK